MDLKEMLKLIDAGFTADEIRKLASAQPAEPTGKVETKAEPKKEVPKKAEPEITKPEESKKEVPAGFNFDAIISGINKKVDELASAIDKISTISNFPAMRSVEPRGIDDVIDKFFGDKKEE